MQLKSDVLPAPLGPITAVILPGSLDMDVVQRFDTLKSKAEILNSE